MFLALCGRNKALKQFERDAAKAYENTIRISDQAYLDPDKQLADKDRTRSLERISKSRIGS
ncbi:MAG: hypothetical protein JKX85_05915 [Phycisphaeraceae bacterium]|nr:hypothetical protein [Phycisphaeraceae bacterium]